MPARLIPVADPAIHPDLLGRKRILGRLLIALDLRIHRQVQKNGSERLGDLAEVARNEMFSRLRDAASLSSFLRDVASATRIRARDWSLSKHPAVKQFHQRVTAETCEACAPGAPSCDHDIIDPYRPAVSGHYLQAFHDLFDRLVSLADDHYRDALEPFATKVNVTLHTQIAADQALHACTTFGRPEAPTARIAYVMIDLPADDLNETHAAQLPYFLFHEIFVHAPEASIAPGVREPSDELSAFREGFMDRVAISVLLKALRNGNLPPPFEHGTLAIKVGCEAAHMHRLEYGTAAAGATPEASHERSYVSSRQLGREIYERLADDLGVDEAVAFAVQLNVLGLTVDQQAALLQVLELGLDARNKPAGVKQRARWLGAFEDLRQAMSKKADSAIVAAHLDKAFDKSDF